MLHASNWSARQHVFVAYIFPYNHLQRSTKDQKDEVNHSSSSIRKRLKNRLQWSIGYDLQITSSRSYLIGLTKAPDLLDVSIWIRFPGLLCVHKVSDLLEAPGPILSGRRVILHLGLDFAKEACHCPTKGRPGFHKGIPGWKMLEESRRKIKKNMWNIVKQHRQTWTGSFYKMDQAGTNVNKMDPQLDRSEIIWCRWTTCWQGTLHSSTQGWHQGSVAMWVVWHLRLWSGTSWSRREMLGQQSAHCPDQSIRASWPW